jgi:hypothetical protein
MGQASLRKQRQRQFYRAGKKQRRQAKSLNAGEGKDKDRREIVDCGAFCEGFLL